MQFMESHELKVSYSEHFKLLWAQLYFFYVVKYENDFRGSPETNQLSYKSQSSYFLKANTFLSYM